MTTNEVQVSWCLQVEQAMLCGESYCKEKLCFKALAIIREQDSRYINGYQYTSSAGSIYIDILHQT